MIWRCIYSLVAVLLFAAKRLGASGALLNSLLPRLTLLADMYVALDVLGVLVVLARIS